MTFAWHTATATLCRRHLPCISLNQAQMLCVSSMATMPLSSPPTTTLSGKKRTLTPLFKKLSLGDGICDSSRRSSNKAPTRLCFPTTAASPTLRHCSIAARRCLCNLMPLGPLRLIWCANFYQLIPASSPKHHGRERVGECVGSMALCRLTTNNGWRVSSTLRAALWSKNVWMSSTILPSSLR